MSKKVKKITVVLSVLILLIIGIITGMHVFNKKDDGIRINLVNLNSKKSDSTYIEIKKNDTFEIKNTSSEDEIIFTGPTNDNALLLAKSFDVQGYDIEIPDSIILQLKDGEKVVAEIELNEENNWTQSLSPIIDVASSNPNKEYDLVEYSENEGELKYYVGSYEFVQTESDTPKLVLTNVATPVLALQKVWDDNDNANSKRPSTVTLELFQEDTLIHSCKVSEETSWLCETPITTYDPTLTYTLKENFESELYTSEVTATPTDESGRYFYYEITNTFSVPDTKIEIPVEKVWVDSDNFAKERPSSVEVALVRNKVVYETKEFTSDMDWKYTFTNLPKYDESGNEYVYEVIELDRVEDYTSSIDGYTITNTYAPEEHKVSFNVTKNWDDNSNYAEKRPEEIKIEVYGAHNENDKDNGVLLKNVTLTSANALEDDNNIWATTIEEFTTTYDYFYLKEENTSEFYEAGTPTLTETVQISSETTETTEKIKIDKIEDVGTGTTCDAWSAVGAILNIEWIDEENINSKRPKSIDVTIEDDTRIRIFEDDYIVLDLGTLSEYAWNEELIEVSNWSADFSGISVALIGEIQYVGVDEVKKYKLPDTGLAYEMDNDSCTETYTATYTYQEETIFYNASITNTFAVPDTKIEFPVEKVWDDNNNEAGERPDSVDIAVVRNGKVFQTKNVTSAMDWKYTFTELPKYDEFGNEYYYEVIELDRLDSYETTIANGIITNTYKKIPTKVSFDIVKNWNDNNNALNKRPSYVEVEIYGTNVENATTGGELLETITLSESNATDDTNKWKTTTSAIETSYKYFYVVENNGSDFYKTTSSIIKSSMIVDPINDTTGTAKVIKPISPEDAGTMCLPSFYIDVKWEDTENSSMRPESVDVTVYLNSTDDSATKTIYGKFRIFEDRAIVLEDPTEKFYSGSGEIYGGYSTTWGVGYAAGFDLDSYYYWIEADDIKYYSTTADIGDANTCDVKGTVINTYEEESTKYQVTLTNTFEIPDTTTNVVINKIWSDNNDEAQKRPDSIVVDIYNGNTIVETATITEANGWEYTSKDLPYYDESANIINYTVHERTTEFYKSSIVDVTPNTTGTSIIVPQTYQITNTFYVPENKVNITVNKVWDDNDDAAGKRPDSVTLQLLADGEKIQDIEVTASANWSTKINNLPKYNAKANEIVYSLDEENVPDFYEKAIPSNYAIWGETAEEKSLSVINMFVVPETTTNVVIKKVWEDNNNEFGKRPESITLQIKEGNTVVSEHQVTAEDNWQYTFEVPKYDANANEIVYTADEKETNIFYEKTISGTTVTNTFNIPEDTIEVTINKVWNDNNDEFGKRPSSVTLQIKSGDTVVGEQRVTADEEWKHTFTVPKYDANANEIVYTADEKETNQFYEKTINGTTVTNNFVIPNITNNVVINKIWSDNYDAASKRPESITVEILRDNTVVETATITETTGWEYTSKDLPYYDNSANVIKYEVREKTIEFYNSNIVDVTPNTTGTSIIVPQTYQITNTFYVPEDKIEVKVSKVWDDNDDKAGKRPDSVTLQIKNGDTVIGEQKVTKNDNWEYTFEVAKYDEKADRIVYTADEKTVPTFYKKTISGTTVTNTFYVPEDKVDVTIKKVWEDNNNEAGKRPDSITLQIKNEDTVIDEYVVTSADSWKHTFTVPKYDENADEITYTADELELNKFYQKTISGTTVTNTFGVPTETIDITSTKVWNDNNDKAGKRPESVTLQIKNGNSIVEEIKVTAEGNWTATFTDLPKYNNLGNEISYTVDEKETPKFYKKEISGTTVTNTFYVPEDTKEVTATKVWNDNNDKANKRPDSIVLQVKDGDTVIEEKEVTAYDNWSATFTVPKYDENADEKSYSVDELETPQFYKKEISGNTITNTFYVPEETIEIEAIKIWDDNDNEAEKRLETITFQLKNGNTIVKEQKVTETDEWTYTFTNLPKYDENADEIKYTLDELETSEFYIKTISEYTITNKFVVPGAQKEISGQKIWDDYNNSYHTRPESVTIEVYGNGELVTEYVISSENDWKFDIKLDLYDDYGNEIEYTLKEEEIEGYDCTIEGYTITNKLETRKIKTEVIGEGGTISGDEDVPYGSDSTIDNIIIKPSNGYILGELRINGELIDIDNKSEEQILEIIKNVREDQLIQVTFVKEKVNDVVDNNPNTSVGEPLIIVIIISLINIFGFKTLKRKRKRFVN